MWQVNEVLCFDNLLYRILNICNGQIIWIPIEQGKGTPKILPELQLEEYLLQGRLTRSADPFITITNEEPIFNSISFLKRNEAYNIIEPIITNKDCFNFNKRKKLIDQVSTQKNISYVTIYKLLRRYWQRGQTPNALIPDYKNSGAPGKNRSGSGQEKVGRSRQYGQGTGIKITADIEKLFRIVLEKYLTSLNDNIKLPAVYRKFLNLFEQYYPKVKPENYPTIRQFRYFYSKEYSATKRLEYQEKTNNYQKDTRPLHSTATTQALGPGSRYEIDATIADIYLVDHDDRSKIIGRPTLYFVIDVFSRMITGFYIGFENPSYVIAMQAFVNACTDKAAFCTSLGIDIDSDDWPCIGLPDVLLADRGELMSHQTEALVSSFNVRVESAPPRRGDAKGIIERNFRTIQSEFIPYAPGVVAGNKIKKHGETDYRKEATLSLFEFQQIILRTILFRNKCHVMDKYDRDADFPNDLPSIPLQIWNWGLQHRTGRLRTANSEQIRVALLPRKKVSISSLGVNMWGMYYSSTEILREGWLQRSSQIIRPQDLEAAYDPISVNHIYLFPEKNSRLYWTCNLTDRSRQFRNLTFHETWEIQRQTKNQAANAKQDEITQRRLLDNFIHETMASAKKNSTNIDKKQSDSKRISQIKSNKNEAVQIERKTKAESLQTKKIATKIIPFNKGLVGNEDFNLPTFVPELFQDPEDS